MSGGMRQIVLKLSGGFRTLDWSHQPLPQRVTAVTFKKQTKITAKALKPQRLDDEDVFLTQQPALLDVLQLFEDGRPLQDDGVLESAGPLRFSAE